MFFLPERDLMVPLKRPSHEALQRLSAHLLNAAPLIDTRTNFIGTAAPEEIYIHVHYPMLSDSTEPVFEGRVSPDGRSIVGRFTMGFWGPAGLVLIGLFVTLVAGPHLVRLWRAEGMSFDVRELLSF